MSATIRLGTDVRHWVEFEVTDATPEEIVILSNDTEEALALARALDKAGRLVYVSEDVDDNPDYFEDAAHPSVIGVLE